MTAFDFFAFCLALGEYKARQAGQRGYAAAAKARQAGSRQETPGDFQVKTAVSARDVARKARQADAERAISPFKGHPGPRQPFFTQWQSP